MSKYFHLQLKRAFKFLPFVLVVALILFSGLTIIFNALLSTLTGSEKTTRFQMGIAGDIGGTYADFGIAALKNFDSSRFAIDLLTMTEEEAEKAIEKGEVSAYVVIPDGFIEAALHGEIMPIKYVTTSGSLGLISIFKEELTSVISGLVETSQKGVYGVSNMLDSNGYQNISNKYMNTLNIEYIDLVLDRSGLYQVNVTGISDGLPMTTYIFCGITVLFLFLTALPYAPLYIKRDVSLNKMLVRGGTSPAKQVFCEYFSYFAIMSVLFTATFAILAFLTHFFGITDNLDIPQGSGMLMYAVQILPVVALITALSFMIFEVSGNLVSGMLLHFFTCISLCYISGCIYPLYTFPVIVQKVAVFFPTALARSFLSSCLSGENHLPKLLGMAVYFAVFLGIAILVRTYKISEKRRCA